MLLAGQYTESFNALEEADNMLDSWDDFPMRDVAGNIHIKHSSDGMFGSTYTGESYYPQLSDLFTSPRRMSYRPTPYERILIHYYKAISLILSNQEEEAEVEARQLELLSDNLDDLKSEEYGASYYVSDAMPQMISGLIYDANLDYNSAFISYENAHKKLSDPKGSFIYGANIPSLLKNDILKLSYLLDFDDRLSNYEKNFNVSYKLDTTPIYAIILIDNGLVPIKNEDYSYYHMRYGMISKGYDTKKNSLLFSKPEFVKAPVGYDTILSITSNIRKQPELLYNPGYFSLKTLNKRFEIETNHYLQEYLKGDSVANSTHQYRHCDTRNWQSLPQTIEYVKIPVDTGLNRILVNHRSGKTDTLSLRIYRKNLLYYLPN
jgi:hypothetical protein